mgnify:CR=1 FL=1
MPDTPGEPAIVGTSPRLPINNQGVRSSSFHSQAGHAGVVVEVEVAGRARSARQAGKRAVAAARGAKRLLDARMAAPAVCAPGHRLLAGKAIAGQIRKEIKEQTAELL